MSGSIPISRSEIEACQEAVQNFRIHELQLLVSTFKYPKIGKKQELISRAISILSNPKFQMSGVQKVREIQANSRVRDGSQPYAYPPAAAGAAGAAAPAAAGQSAQQQPNGMANNAIHNIYQQYPPASGMPLPQSPNFPNYFMNYPAVSGFGSPYQQYAAQFHHAAQFPQLNPQQQHHHQQQQHVLPVSSGSGGGGGGQLVRNLRVVELPFFDMIKVVLPMTELPSYSVPTRPGEGRYNCQFGLAPEDIPKLNYADDRPLPRMELQMRVFLLETSQEQPDAFPPNTTVRLDDFVVNLPPVIPTNKPNAEQKRYSRHVNLTPYLRPPRAKDRPHRMHFEWNGDKRAWAFTVLLVNRLNSDILLDRMRKNVRSTRQFDKTKETIIRRLSGDEDDVQMDSLKISLIDPLARTRIRIPARAVDCTHLQCFDLYSYLMMNEKRPGWKCPVCDRNAIYSKLIIDEYFERILKSVAPGVEEVELLKDGTWRLAQANQAVSLDSEEEAETPAGEGDDEDIMIVEKPAKAERKKTPAAERPTSQPGAAAAPRPAEQPKPTTTGTSEARRPTAADKDVDVICLSSDDDDDEDQQLATAIAVSCMGGGGAGNISSSDGDGTPNSSSCGSGSGTGRSSSQQQPPVTSRNAAGQQQQQRPATTSTSAGAGGGGGGGDGPHHHQQNGHHVIGSNNGSAASHFLQLHTNSSGSNNAGQPPPIFRPAIDQLAKTEVAQRLAVFLQGVHARNNNNNH